MLILILCAASTFTFHGDAHAHQAALRMELNGGRGVGQPCTVGSPVAPLGRSRGCLGIMSSVEKPKNELQLPLGALSAGLTAAIEAAVELEARDFAKATPDLRALELEEEELEGHKSRLLTELGDIQTTGLVFQSDGTPSASTLGIALVLTARRVSELDVPSVADLISSRQGGNHSAHLARADLALATAVSDTLAEMEAAEMTGAQAETMHDARSIHMRWAILEMARARYAKDRPADWGSVGA